MGMRDVLSGGIRAGYDDRILVAFEEVVHLFRATRITLWVAWMDEHGLRHLWPTCSCGMQPAVAVFRNFLQLLSGSDTSR